MTRELEAHYDGISFSSLLGGFSFGHMCWGLISSHLSFSYGIPMLLRDDGLHSTTTRCPRHQKGWLVLWGHELALLVCSIFSVSF
ncbi:hypothetical protein IWX50DRAFT_627750 [Phyllosticta citricarpa]